MPYSKGVQFPTIKPKLRKTFENLLRNFTYYKKSIFFKIGISN